MGFPATGEFIAKLTASNACGHSATAFFGILFNTNIGLLNRRSTFNLPGISVPFTTATFGYVVRVILNQSSNATATVTVTTADNNSLPVVQTFTVNKYTTFDKKFTIIPQTDIKVDVTYSTSKNQTTFKSATVGNLPIFVNNTTTTTSALITSISQNSNYETRSITLANVTANNTINFNLTGIENVNANNLIAESTFNVKNINVKTTQL